MSISWDAAGGSDIGRRRRGNEDTLRLDVSRGIFLVADGMGGHAAGEVASELAASTVEAELARAVDSGAPAEALPSVLSTAFGLAHGAIASCCSNDPRTRGMGTTLTACVLNSDGVLQAGHIGDSRLYRLRGGQLEQLTRDHTVVQREVDAGRISAQAAQHHPLSHILTRVLSQDLEPELDLLSGTVLPGDLLLLASDGLYNMIDDERILGLLSAEAPLPQQVGALISAANDAGGADNITVILVRIRPS